MKKLNLKKTWWILLLMFLEFLLFLITICSIDYVLSNQDLFSSFDETFIGKYSYLDILMVVHVSFITFLLLILGGCIWLILFKLFDKFKNK